MKLKLKGFNSLKIAKHMYNNSLTFFVQGINLKKQTWLKIEQHLYNKNIKCYQLNNSMTRLYLINSIFKNYLTSLNSNNFLLTNKSVNFKQLLDLTSTFYFLFIKLNTKFYFVNKNFYRISFNYKNFIKNFTFLLFKSSIIPIKLFKKI